MEIEYLTDVVEVDSLDFFLNSKSKEGWSLHTVLGFSATHFYVIMEGAKAEEPEPEHQPMRMKGF